MAIESDLTYASLVVTPHADFAQRLGGNFNMSQNFPNPVLHSTTFRFHLPQAWDAEGKRVSGEYPLRINLYDYSGRQVAEVAKGNFRAGSHSLTWKAATRTGAPLAKGAYVYRLETRGFTKSLKLLME
jgi:hypothetical protein